MHAGSLESTREALELLKAIANRNSSFLSALQTSQVHPFNHYSVKAHVISLNS